MSTHDFDTSDVLDRVTITGIPRPRPPAERHAIADPYVRSRFPFAEAMLLMWNDLKDGTLGDEETTVHAQRYGGVL